MKNKLEKAEGDVVRASASFAAAAQEGSVYALKQEDFKVGGVSAAEMVAVYESRMVKGTSPGRFIYDEIMVSSAEGRCPLCGHRDVSTLDHHLPKKLFPALAVTPLNLIPACSECNKTKLHGVAGSPGKQTLHPYFENVESDPWLVAEVIEGEPVVIVFKVDSPDHWDSVLCERVRHHFQAFGLPALYMSQAVQELNNISHYLKQLFDRGGPDQVSVYLEDQAVSRRIAHVNSWQTAMYTALAQNRWFCENVGLLSR
ncbi:hypothetical protein AB0I85_30660 [Micromonospora echinofusca]|uniref:HNH endonuclease n=1 Tax=Micromonospora echinofusca TaxID=47858 RepID=UPI0033E702C9